MIVREVLQHPELIDRFDYFNDSADTISFLRGCKTPEANALAEQLQKKSDEWFEAWRQQSLAAINTPEYRAKRILDRAMRGKH